MAGIRIPGSETFIPDNALQPRSWSTSSGDEMPLSLQVHSIDFVFDFYIHDAAAPPASATWLVLSPRAAGKITAFHALIKDNGTSTDVDVILKKNGTTQMASDLTITQSSTENAWIAGSLTGGEVTFVADDRIEIGIVNTAATGALGLKARIRGYYTGD